MIATSVMLTMTSAVFRKIRTFLRDRSGTVAVTFGISLVPLSIVAGGSIDYGVAVDDRAILQRAVDAGALAGANTSSNQQQTASAFTNSNLSHTNIQNVSVQPVLNSDKSVTVSASGSVPTAFLSIAGIAQINISATAKAATAIARDNSCLLTLDSSQSVSNVSLTLDGAPNVNLTGCSLRSNTSMSCNGHNGSATASLATGIISNCSNSQSGTTAVPDIYKSLSSNITTRCASGYVPGATWIPGSPPGAPNVITVYRTGYTEYHVCGTLTLSGTGYLTGSAPSTDSVIIVENGGLNVAADAAINTVRTAIVLTGDNSQSSSVVFPNGAGKAATLALSPPTSAGDPWRGISLYQDPKLTNGVDESWGPGANFNADGVVYLPNASVTVSGNLSSSNSKCTKLVFSTFASNGSVNLNFQQSDATCASIGMTQYAGVPARLLQ